MGGDSSQLCSPDSGNKNITTTHSGSCRAILHPRQDGRSASENHSPEIVNRSTFIAFPVSQGDAFYLQRGSESVLMDGGISASALPIVFTRETGTDGVSILVCSHNDADHANGALGFLLAGFCCDEIWLPALWLESLIRVPRSPERLLQELLRDCEEWGRAEWRSPPRASSATLEELAERLTGERDRESPFDKVAETETDVLHVRLGADGWPTDLEPGPEPEEDWELRWLDSVHNPLKLELELRYYLRHAYWVADQARQLVLQSFAAAGRIRRISSEAMQRGIPVRWFRYSVENPTGGTDLLRPVNSRESAVTQMRRGSLINLLALTVSNRESLAFWAPPGPNRTDGVLFTADSDLAGVTLPSDLDGAIVSAPHHGAKSSAHAYTVIAKALLTSRGGVSWVRSDCRSRNRPSEEYVNLRDPKYCTICRIDGAGWTRKQVVRFQTRRGKWSACNRTTRCSCGRPT